MDMKRVNSLLSELDIRVPIIPLVTVKDGGKGKKFMTCERVSGVDDVRRIINDIYKEDNFYSPTIEEKLNDYLSWKNSDDREGFVTLRQESHRFYLFFNPMSCSEATSIVKDRLYKGFGNSIKVASQTLKIKEQEGDDDMENQAPEAPRSDVEVISTERAVELIKGSGGKTFDVSFRKRTGERELRRMNARLGVRKGVKGVGRNFDPEEKGLISVYEMPKDQFRFISIESIRSLRIGKKKYIVRPLQLEYTAVERPGRTRRVLLNIRSEEQLEKFKSIRKVEKLIGDQFDSLKVGVRPSSVWLPFDEAELLRDIARSEGIRSYVFI